MACTLVAEPQQAAHVGMGQIIVGRSPLRMTAVLGSCLGLALYHARTRIGGMGHLVLPESAGRASTPGKFVDTAVPAMLAEMEKLGAHRSGIIARMAGGACMFGKDGPLQIGESNIKAAIELLDKLNIRLMATDLGGDKGRRVHFHCETGQLHVEIAGQPSRVL